MIEDPLTSWPGPFPYRVLAGFGITPQSTQADVRDVVFELMNEDMMNPTTQQASGQLRDLAGRLLADLLLYDIDLEADLDQWHDRVTRELADLREQDEIAPPVDLDSFPTQAFIDGVIRFDR